MFFSKKSESADKGAPIAAILADFFQLDSTQTASWIEQNTVTLPFACQTQQAELQEKLPKGVQLTQVISSLPTNKPALQGIKNIVAVASGKGGVGKSATTVNLACALMHEGARVGILDADIYGPSIPIMLGNGSHQPDSPDGKNMQPLNAHGLVANSIGYLVDPQKAAIWRGPMAGKALMQLLTETLWPALDYLLIDMPPGTGDIQLTLAQQAPVSGAVIVTTPQDIALADARKGISMFEQVDIPVLGVVENMSYFQCGECGHKTALFATDGGVRLAQQHKTPLLGQLPLDIRIRELADSGVPLLLEEPESPLSEAYRQAARLLSQRVYLCSIKPGQKIAVQNVP